MRISALTVSLAGLSVLALALPVRAQEVSSSNEALQTPPSVERSVVFNFGVGQGNPLDLAGSAALSFEIGEALDLTVRATETIDFNLFSPSDQVGDVAVLVGKRAASGKSWVRASVGLGWARSLDYGEGYDCYWFSCEYDETEAVAMGLALQGDTALAIWRSFGIGLTVFGNLNPARSFAGFSLGLYLGRQR
ncbi:MAG: hypothetical protein ACPHO4_12300 [Longimicrobiales bacterium]